MLSLCTSVRVLLHLTSEFGGRGGSLQIASVVFHPTITMSQELNCGRSSTVDYQLSFIQLSGISMEELKGLSANTTCRTVSLPCMLEARPAKPDSSTQRHMRTLPCFAVASGIFQLPCVAGLAQRCPLTLLKIDPHMPGQFKDKAGEHLCNFFNA